MNTTSYTPETAAAAAKKLTWNQVECLRSLAGRPGSYMETMFIANAGSAMALVRRGLAEVYETTRLGRYSTTERKERRYRITTEGLDLVLKLWEVPLEITIGDDTYIRARDTFGVCSTLGRLIHGRIKWDDATSVHGIYHSDGMPLSVVKQVVEAVEARLDEARKAVEASTSGVNTPDRILLGAQ